MRTSDPELADVFVEELVTILSAARLVQKEELTLEKAAALMARKYSDKEVWQADIPAYREKIEKMLEAIAPATKSEND